jgi:16S rRNA (cytosine1402-N4)-methyltransferase
MDHVPVMSDQVMEHMAVRPDGVYLDCTAGLGGHTGLIARKLETGLVIAGDRDAESLEAARRNTASWADRIRFHHGRFSEIGGALQAAGVEQVDGLLADLGCSRYQLTDGARGFSFQTPGPLNMRMDRGQDRTAADIVNYSDEEVLADLIFRLGEERRARKIARALVRARPVRTTAQLAAVVESVVHRTGKLHPATLTFQSLRLAVNEEQEELDALLDEVPRLVKPGGRVVVISFMSLEDRKVKQCFQRLAREGRARILTKHVVRPTEDEVRANPSARSAKLRALEMSANRERDNGDAGDMV